jgi:hypothetical protein
MNRIRIGRCRVVKSEEIEGLAIGSLDRTFVPIHIPDLKNAYVRARKVVQP